MVIPLRNVKNVACAFGRCQGTHPARDLTMAFGYGNVESVQNWLLNGLRTHPYGRLRGPPREAFRGSNGVLVTVERT